LIPHQANVRIIEATAKQANVSMDKVYVNVDRYGNTSAASIPIGLAEAVAEGALTPGKRVLYLTKDPERIRQQLAGTLTLRMSELSPDELLEDVRLGVAALLDAVQAAAGTPRS
jgi:hypothetical protein